MARASPPAFLLPCPAAPYRSRHGARVARGGRGLQRSWAVPEWCTPSMRQGCGASKPSKYAVPTGEPSPSRTMARQGSNLSHRPALSSDEGFAAFISHVKAEASMEARFLQTELCHLEPRNPHARRPVVEIPLPTGKLSQKKNSQIPL